MTVVRYEETPVFEMDWNKLELLGSAFSDEAIGMIVYRGRLQGNYYAGDPLNFDALAADIADVEMRLTALEGGFVSWQLRKVFDYQVQELIARVRGGPLVARNADKAFGI